jgi:hypothetical protein
MRKRSIAIAFALLIVVTTAPIAAFFGLMWYIERQRVEDADPAFRPLLPLEPVILSQPIAFHRHCRYIIIFPSDGKLSDTRVAELACLNELPAGNWLDLVIETREVTDRSIAHLKSIHTLTNLDVTKTSISNEGIAELRSALPDDTVIQRQIEPANKARSQNKSPVGNGGDASVGREKR